MVMHPNTAEGRERRELQSYTPAWTATIDTLAKKYGAYIYTAADHTLARKPQGHPNAMD